MKTEINQGLINSEKSIEIRKAVFVEEQGFVDEFDAVDDTAYHILIWDEDIPVATGRIFLDGNGEYHIGRVAVIKNYRRKGVGRLVMNGLEEKAIELGARCISLSSQIQASGFYKSLGYSPVGEEYFDQHCPHIKMVKQL